MRNRIITGLDIGHHSIKAVSVRPDKNGITLMQCNEVLTTGDIFADNHKINYQGSVNNFKELKSVLPVRSRRLAVSLPDNAVISKAVTIDEQLESEERERVIYELFSRQSLIPGDTLNIDFVRDQQNSGATQSGEVSYLVYATRKEVVESRLQLLRDLGFNPVLMDMQAHGLLQVYQLAYEKLSKQDIWLLVDIGRTQTVLCAESEDGQAFYRTIPAGTQQLTDLNAEPSPAMLYSFCSSLAQQISRQLQILNSLNISKKVTGIWLSGGGCLYNNLPELLAEELQFPLEIFSALTLPESCHRTFKLPDSSCVFNTALGLAIRGSIWTGRKYVA